MGRAYETIVDGALPEVQRNRLNKRLGKHLHIARAQSESHMWNGGTLVDYLEFLKGEVRAQRERLGLDATHRALIIFDRAGAHISKVYARIRKQFSEELNCELLCSDGDVQIPGGFGVKGGPNDQLHQFLHAMQRAYNRLVSGRGDDPNLRKALQDIQRLPDGLAEQKQQP